MGEPLTASQVHHSYSEWPHAATPPSGFCAREQGVPEEERLPAPEFDFYLDLLKCVAITVSKEHTLNVKGLGAFWNLMGSMSEIQVPVFVLIQALTSQFEER